MMLAVFAGVAIVGGILLVGYGLVTPTDHQSTNLSTGVWISRLSGHVRELGLGIGVGIVVWWWCQLPLAALVAGIVAALFPWLLSAPKNRDVELCEALDRWIRGLATLLPTGVSIGEAVRGSVRYAPELLVEHIEGVIRHLNDRWTLRDALWKMADDLDSPEADAVIAALALAGERGGTGAAATLSALADSVQERLKALREIETERAKPRAVVRQVSVITVVVLSGALVMGRGFFEPYSTIVGQIILSIYLLAYLGSLAMLRRMTTDRRRPRILTGAP